ncbi:aspartyl aminopeptidase, putative [Eimeria necatrix]|uniref:aspartyl aminopeptidase n=1 Tax=Eimeria necatrix TaxID=51315 RepID=U6MKI0_9EIME|nr:aspartyl aminopeptidase, putative [Eimeria necatrix]CDJ63563.1 aspartyl aminopeptidase, putative [Eimeria necatrix]
MALEEATPLARNFINFVNRTGSPYHSVQAVRDFIASCGFEELHERASWKMTQGGRYFVTRNGSCIAAFIVGRNFQKEAPGGFCVTATHSDSPCLRLRPRAFAEKEGYQMGSVECYGGGLWHTWFDRGLGVAGKVVLHMGYKVEERLVHIPKPLFYVPSLAIHLKTPEEIGAVKINKEQHLQPVLCSVIAEQLNQGNGSSIQEGESEVQRLPPALERLVRQEIGMPGATLLDWDLCLMDATPGRLSGIHSEFIESPRLDNLASTFAAFKALVEAGQRQRRGEQDCGETDILMAVAFDHEEVGSESLAGANSSLLETWMRRSLKAIGCEDALHEILAKSFIVSSDMAHAVHPNYSEKHQAQHKPSLHKESSESACSFHIYFGVVIKENANQSYASSATTMSLIRVIAGEANIPLQDFVVRNDSRCGGTVGAMLSARLGIRTVDVGIAQWAMHSCREICGVTDLMYLKDLLEAVYCNFRRWDSN